MATTRREFIEGSAVVGLALALGAGGGAAASSLASAADAQAGAGELCGENGCPHLLARELPPDELGFELDPYERLREEVVHLAMSPEDRERYLLGL